MADYVLPVKTAIIEYDEYDGLEVEVRVSPIPIGEYVEGIKYVDELGDRLQELDDLTELADFVGRYLVRSNLNTPTREWPHTLLLSTALAWARVVGQVMPPLPRVSSGTARFLGASRNPSSSTTPTSSTPSSGDTPATPSEPS